MKKSLLFMFTLTIAVSTLLFSCKKEEAPVQNTNNNNNNTNAYAGNWEGTFSGDDNGTWTVVIDSKGDLSGSLNSANAPGNPFAIEGKISSTGVFDAYAVVMGDSVDFDGQANDSLAAGTWSNVPQGVSGTWTGSKK